MPELPEVESLRRYLVREGMIGRTFEWVGIEDKPESANGTGTLAGARLVVDQSVKSIERRGKQLAVVLDEFVLGFHMGMTGQVHILDSDDTPARFIRAVFNLTDDFRIALVDPRRWAKIQHFESLEHAFSGLGPDALDPDFTSKQFATNLDGRTAQIKPLLLNQAIIAGVGNIYADEALHRVEISPARRVNTISKKNLGSLFDAIRISLEHSLDFILKHPDERGRPYIVDAYDDRMQLHRKPGSFCPRCEIPLVTLKFGGRTAYYCGNCQK
ncbi:MAG: DNA-formamidopyrimidine glycosylase family protein [Dehalococcoidia bacterium]|nr:DNA-formamidopyrimidine glycosylase family protein [Dehalococcoidia bacterium]